MWWLMHHHTIKVRSSSPENEQEIIKYTRNKKTGIWGRFKKPRNQPRIPLHGQWSITAFKMGIPTMDIKYQLVPPSNNRDKNAGRSIQTFKNHFIVELFSVDKDFHLQLWYILLHNANISLNMLRKSRIHPHSSAYMQIFGELDFNYTTLAPH